MDFCNSVDVQSLYIKIFLCEILFIITGNDIAVLEIAHLLLFKNF